MGPKTLARIGIKFYSQMSVSYVFNQTIVGDVFGDTVRLNVLLLDMLSSKCNKVVVPWCFGVALCGADVRHWWSWRRWNGYTIQEWHPPTYNATILAEFREKFVLMDDNSHPHRAHIVNEFLHYNNIARLEWPVCSPDMKPIEHAWNTLKRAVFLTRWPTNHSERSTPNRRWGVGQSGPTGPWWTSAQYATTNTGMHQCKGTCYWVLEVLVYAATWHTNSESVVVLLYNLQFLVLMSNTESWNVVFVHLYSICM